MKELAEIIIVIWVIVVTIGMLISIYAVHETRADYDAIQHVKDRERLVITARASVRREWFRLIEQILFMLCAVVFIIAPTDKNTHTITSVSLVISGLIMLAELLTVINIYLDRKDRNRALKNLIHLMKINDTQIG